MAEAIPASDRRAGQRDRLIACAEAAIAEGGLATLRARNLATCVGCSIGAIYNLVGDLDALVLLVAQRTLAELQDCLDAVDAQNTRSGFGPDRFVAWALAYSRFAAGHRNRWRALFEYRLPVGRSLPERFQADQMRLFERLEAGLGAWMPEMDSPTRRIRARTLFSAVHGIVALGLEEKIVAMPITAVETELAIFVRAFLIGMHSATPAT